MTFLSGWKLSTLYFFNKTATTVISSLPLHDALPISRPSAGKSRFAIGMENVMTAMLQSPHFLYRAESLERPPGPRPEEHTSELQSRQYIVCRLLLVKKSISLRQEPELAAHIICTSHY